MKRLWVIVPHIRVPIGLINRIRSIIWLRHLAIESPLIVLDLLGIGNWLVDVIGINLVWALIIEFSFAFRNWICLVRGFKRILFDRRIVS